MCDQIRSYKGYTIIKKISKIERFYVKELQKDIGNYFIKKKCKYENFTLKEITLYYKVFFKL